MQSDHALKLLSDALQPGARITTRAQYIGIESAVNILAATLDSHRATIADLTEQVEGEKTRGDDAAREVREELERLKAEVQAITAERDAAHRVIDDSRAETAKLIEKVAASERRWKKAEAAEETLRQRLAEAKVDDEKSA